MKSLISKSTEWTFLKKVTIITPLILICSTLPQHAKAAASVKEVNKLILTCAETETGSDVNLKVETIITKISFNQGGSITYPSKRILTLSVNNKTARSVIMNSEIPSNISAEEASNFPFLNDNYIGADGTGYSFQRGFYDKYNNHYSDQKKPSEYLFFGQALLKCTEISESLEETECLSKTEELEISEFKKEIAKAKLQNPGCEKSYGAAACISPFKEAKLRYLKSKTVKCQ